MSGKVNFHLGLVSIGTDGFVLHHGLKVGAEIGALGVGVDANAALTTGEFGAKAEASAGHTSNWYALQPITCPARAFGNLLRQVDADYGQFVPNALRVDGPGYYERVLEEMVLPKLRELGWADAGLLSQPSCIYGRFRIELSAGGHLFVKYGKQDADGFKWYGVSGNIAAGAQAKISAAVGLLANDAVQIRIAVGNLRLSFILSKRPLGLRNDEQLLDNTTIAERLRQEASPPANNASNIHGYITLDGAGIGDPIFTSALEAALAGALSGACGVGCVSVSSTGGDSRRSRFIFDVDVNDPHDIQAARMALETEAASGGARKFLPVLTDALERAGLGSGHLRVVLFELDGPPALTPSGPYKITSL